MINYNKLCIFDFETDGVDPRVCSPVQMAAVIVDPIKLEILPNSEFNIFFKPDTLAKDDNYVYTTDILEFHAKVRGCKKEDILKEWKKYPSQERFGLSQDELMRIIVIPISNPNACETAVTAIA